MVRLLGAAIGADDQRALLGRVGIETVAAVAGTEIVVAGGPQPLSVPADGTETLVAIVPSWRRDLAIEADVTEEVARVRGYETIPEILPHTPMPHYRPSPLRLRDAVRAILAGAGLTETVTSALVAPEAVERFPAVEEPAVPGEGRAGGRVITVTNPLSSQHSVMRQRLTGSLLEVLGANVRQGQDGVAIFEIGKGYAALEEEEGTHEWWRLALALTGPAEPPAWNRPTRPYDLDDAKGLLELVARHLGLPRPTYEPLRDDPILHPGRAATVRAGDGLVGRVGEVHPALHDELDLRAERVLVAEVAIAGLSGGQPSVPRGRTPSRHPVVDRDLAVVVGLDQGAGAVEAAIRAHGGPLLVSADLFDRYRGRPLGDDEQSLAYRLVFAADDRTLTEAEVDEAVAAIVTGLGERVGGRLRT